MFATLLLCTSSTLRLPLPCPLQPEGPSFLLCFLALLFHPVIPTFEARGCTDRTPLVQRMTGSDLLLPGLSATPFPPACGLAPARPGLLQPGEQGTGKRVCAGAALPVPIPPGHGT